MNTGIFIDNPENKPATIQETIKTIPAILPIVAPVPLEPMKVSGNVEEIAIEQAPTPIEPPVEAAPKVDRRRGPQKTDDPLFPYGKKADGSAKSKPGRKPKVKMAE